ncbi:MAG: histidine phosphatase family protein [Paracoccaceae bacterium]
MRRLYYLSHPEVVIDPAVPVPDWGLSEKGRARLTALADSGWPGPLAAIFSSPECKARETAAPFALRCGIIPQVRAGLAEVDRSATGYLPFDAHEAYADRLFAHPDESAGGWETARAAQTRTMDALTECIAGAGHAGDILIVGHGAVGSLGWCAIAGLPILRSADQPAGGGCIWTALLDGATLRPERSWRRMEDMAPR